MKIVVGLGNPGSRYDGTRHNVGFEVLRELGRRWGAARPKARFEAELIEILCGVEKLLLCAPQTYMNLSGRSVQNVVKFYQVPVTDLLVVADDLNLKTGQIRLRPSGSAGGQKGLQSILTCLGTDAVPRLRIGIGRPSGEMDPADYVLSRFRKDEMTAMEEAIQRAASAVELWASQGVTTSMNKYNAAPESEPEEPD